MRAICEHFDNQVINFLTCLCFSTEKTSSAASLACILLSLLPALICEKAVFHAELACHSPPLLPTYPDILFGA